jgi:hypothetical protein
LHIISLNLPYLIQLEKIQGPNPDGFGPFAFLISDP